MTTYMEHSKELASRHIEMVAKPASNDRVMHDRLVRFIFEVLVPSTLGDKLGRGPLRHLIQLRLGWSGLHARLDTICCKRTGAFEVPLVEDPPLGLGIASSEVIKRLSVWCSAVGGEMKIVVLEVETYTRQIHNSLDTSFFELLLVANTRSLENKG
jgi:hypothetical protein